MVYIPNEPYLFKSGKYQGKSVSQIAINNFPWLKYLFGKMNEVGKSRNKNQLHVHLEWLMRKISKTEPKMICPVCKKNPVKFISVLGNNKYGYSISESFTCCEDKNCKNKLKSLALGNNNQFIFADFSSVAKFNNKTDQRRITSLLKKIYKLEGKLTKERAFKFFLEG
jgi:hypothetical protein